jgi:hypothetical protein
LIRSLRKGHTRVDLQYEHTCDSITSEQFEAEVKDRVAIFRFSLRPSGENQRDDEENLHTYSLVSVALNEPQILKNLRGFNEAHKTEYSQWAIEVLSRGKPMKFLAKPSVAPSGRLQFAVHRETGG